MLDVRRVALATVFLLAACSSDPGGDSPKDASARVDAASGDGATDAGTMDARTPDANVPRDAAMIDGGPGDESIRGTSLEGVRIEWSQPLELCNTWREQRTLDEELAAKVQVTLQPSPRASLGSGDLGASTLAGGIVRSAPTAGGQFVISEVRSSLIRYELFDPTTDTRVYAELDHDLGPAGVLTEIFDVFRTRGDPRPVITGASRWEHGFTIKRPQDAEPITLERCGGPDDLREAADVLTGTAGSRGITVLRILRTREALAGSYPVYLQQMVLRISDEPMPLFVQGFWPMTYSAAHHNWDEDTLIDFTRDLSWHETVWEPYLDGNTPPLQEMVTQAKLKHIDQSVADPEIELTKRNLTNDAETIETFAVQGRWVRVDSETLLRELAPNCPNGRVLTLRDYASYAFQAVTCPRTAAPGFDLLALVPVSFPRDITKAGARITGAAITPETRQSRAGYRIAIGDASLSITKSAGETYYWMVLFDGGGQVISEWLGEHSTLDERWADETIRGESADQGVRASMIRRYAGQGVGESSIFAPVSLTLTFGGTTYLIDAWDALDYTNTHHNWNDELVAKQNGLTFTWTIRYEGWPLTHRLKVTRDSDGAVVLPETGLSIVDS